MNEGFLPDWVNKPRLISGFILLIVGAIYNGISVAIMGTPSLMNEGLTLVGALLIGLSLENPSKIPESKDGVA